MGVLRLACLLIGSLFLSNLSQPSCQSLCLILYCINIQHLRQLHMNITLLGKAIEEPVNTAWCIPLYIERVSAGFPSPAQDYIEQTLDLNELCISHPAATFFVRVEGESMTGAGIFPNDILVVDRSLEAKHGDIVIASLDNEMTVKKLHLNTLPIVLMPCNPKYRPLIISEDVQLEIFGVVTNVVRSLKR